MLAINEDTAVVAGAAFTVSVPLASDGYVTAISVTSPTATQAELQVTGITLGNSPILNNPGAAAVSWNGVSNSLGTTWYRFPSPVPAKAAQAVQVTGINGNAGAADCVVCVEYTLK